MASALQIAPLWYLCMDVHTDVHTDVRTDLRTDVHTDVRTGACRDMRHCRPSGVGHAPLEGSLPWRSKGGTGTPTAAPLGMPVGDGRWQSRNMLACPIMAVPRPIPPKSRTGYGDILRQAANRFGDMSPTSAGRSLWVRSILVMAY